MHTHLTLIRSFHSLTEYRKLPNTALIMLCHVVCLCCVVTFGFLNNLGKYTKNNDAGKVPNKKMGI